MPSVTPKVFQTLIGKALPQPVTPKAFQTLMMQAIPAPVSRARARSSSACCEPRTSEACAGHANTATNRTQTR